MHFDQALELAGRQLVFPPEGFEQRDVKQVRGWHHAFLTSGGRGRQRAEGDLRKGRVGLEPGIVAVVAQVVKGFIGVLDGYFGDGSVGEKGTRYSGEEVRAMRVVLVGRKDEELRDAGAGREGIGVNWVWKGQGKCLETGFGGGGVVSQEAVAG